MKITDFAHRVSTHERGKKQVDITQILSVMAIINKMTHGVLYAIVKILPA